MGGVGAGLVQQPVGDQRLPLAGVDAVDELEGGPAVQPDAVAPRVELRPVQAPFAACPERVEVERRGCRAEQGADLGAHDGPALPVVLLADADGQGPVLRGDRRLQGEGRRVGPRHGQRPADLQVPHLDRPVQGPAAGAQRHLDVGGRRHEDVLADPVVAEPGHELRFHGAVPDGVRGGHPLARQRVVEGAVAGGPDDQVLRRAVPVPLVLPRVGGQVDDPAGAGEVVVPVGAGVGGEHRRDGRRRLAHAVPLPVQGGDAAGPGAAQVGAQHRVRADLDQDAGVLLGEEGGGLREPDRLADVAPPVLGVQLRPLQRGAGDGGDEGDAGGRGGEPVEGVEQRLPDGVHGAAVEGVVEGEFTEEDTARGQVRAPGRERVGVPGDGHVPFAVDARELQGVPVGAQFLACLFLGQADGGHPAPARRGALGAAAFGDHQRRLLQRQDTGGVRGGDLADAVACHRARTHPVRGQQRGQARLHGEQGGLGDLRALPGRRPGVRQLLGHRPAEVGRQGRVGLLDGRAEDRGALQQVGAHAGPLGGVAGVHERGAAPLAGADEGPPGGLGGRQQLQLPGGLLRVGGQDGRAVRMRGAPHGAGVGEVVELPGRGVPQPPRHAGGHLLECLRGARGDHQRQRARLRFRRRLRFPAGGRREDHDVRVGPAEAEGGHAHRRPRSHRQRDGLHGGREPQTLEVDRRVERPRVQRGRHRGVAQHQDRLEQPGHPRGGLQMAEVRLHRADRQRPAAPAPAQRPPDGLGLRRVADLGPGAVGLDVHEVVRVDPGLPVDRVQQRLLRLGAGHDQARAAAVGVVAGGGQHGVHPVAVGQRVREPLQDEHRAALRAHEPVGLGGEGGAAAAPREHARVGEPGERVGRRQHVDPAGQRDAAGALAQGAAGAVEGDQRGGAGRVHRHARPAQVEGVRQAVRGEGQGGAGHRVRTGVVLHHRQGHPVAGVGDAHVHAGVRSGEGPGGQRGVVQGLGGHLQEQPLLRVDVPGLGGRHAEIRGVERGDVLEEAARGGVTAAGSHGLRVHHALPGQPVGGHLPDHVPPVPQHGPQSVQIRDASGKPAADSHHRHGPFEPIHTNSPQSRAGCALWLRSEGDHRTEKPAPTTRCGEDRRTKGLSA
nr:hypothetical protein [Streptomyces sp. MH191]